MFCTNCGAQIDDKACICVKCGVFVQNSRNPAPTYTTYQPNYTQPNYPVQNQQNFEPASGEIKIGMLIWSIFNALTMPILGIFAIVLTAMASGETTLDGELKKIRAARILNIISTVIFVLTIIVCVVAIAAVISAVPDIYDEFYDGFYYEFYSTL